MSERSASRFLTKGAIVFVLVACAGLSSCSQGRPKGGADETANSSVSRDGGGAKELVTVRHAVGLPSLTLATAPFSAVGPELGYFSKYGIRVKGTPTKGAGESLQLLAGGGAETAEGGTSAGFAFIEKNPDMRILLSSVKNIYEIVVPTTSSVHNIKDLKGETIGVLSVGSASHRFAEAVVENAGLDPKTDVHWLPVGVGTQVAAAFESGDIAAFASYNGGVGPVENILGKSLRPVPSILDDLPSSYAVYTTKKFINQDPKVVVDYLSGLYSSYIFCVTNPEAAVRIFWKKFPDQKPPGEDESKAAQVWARAMLPYWEGVLPKAFLPPNNEGEFGIVPVKSVQATADFMSKYGLIDKSIDVRQYVDFDLVKKAVSQVDAKSVIKQAREWSSSSN